MTGYYLLDHPNPNCPDRGDGKYWGYAEMQGQPFLIAVHTTESFADELGEDMGAENVAAYFSRSTTAASYHTIVDSDSTVRCLPAGLDGTTVHTAFHCYGRNTGTLGISFAMRASEWPTVSPAWATAALERAADEVALWCRRWDIPARRVSRAEADAGVSGITGHGILQPEDRTDPGASTTFEPSLFPWDRFLGMVNERLNGEKPKAEGEEYMLQHFLRVTEGELKDTIYARYTTGALVPIAPEEFDTDGGKVSVKNTTTAGLRMALSNQ